MAPGRPGGRRSGLSEIDGTDIATLHPPLLALYATCFGAPPWQESDKDVAAYAARIRRWAALDSFVGFVAHEAVDRLVGAAYGRHGPPEARGVRLPGVTAAMPFHVADLMVHPDAQRQGLGRRLLDLLDLLDLLVDGQRPALLLTHPQSVSRHLYDAAGWRSGETVELPDSLPMVIYTLD